MKEFAVTCYRGHRFGDAIPLTATQRDDLIAVFQQTNDSVVKEILGGRKAVRRIDLSGIGSVVVKQFARGGVIRYINHQTYLKLGTPRCAREMGWLQEARRLGICVPHPVAWADDGGHLFYRCWLVTKTIPETVSLAQMGLQNPKQPAAVFPMISRQMAILIENRIHHKDMHPGNILVDGQGDVFFIDFDKAARHRGSRRSLAARYLQRWRRAVAKYGLPQELDRLMAKDLSQQWNL